MYLQTAIEEIISPNDVKRLGRDLFVLVDGAPPEHMYLQGNWKNRAVVMAIGGNNHDHTKIKRSDWLFSTTNQCICRYVRPKHQNEQGQNVVVIVLADGAEKWTAVQHLRVLYPFRVCDVIP
jgi:hypothetical protein